jgi:hypothetical protein
VHSVKHATGFLTWLADRGPALHGCRQADVDLWHAGHHTHALNALRSFRDTDTDLDRHRGHHQQIGVVRPAAGRRTGAVA